MLWPDHVASLRNIHVFKLESNSFINWFANVNSGQTCSQSESGILSWVGLVGSSYVPNSNPTLLPVALKMFILTNQK